MKILSLYILLISYNNLFNLCVHRSSILLENTNVNFQPLEWKISPYHFMSSWLSSKSSWSSFLYLPIRWLFCLEMPGRHYTHWPQPVRTSLEIFSQKRVYRFCRCWNTSFQIYISFYLIIFFESSSSIAFACLFRMVIIFICFFSVFPWLYL